MAVSAGQTSYVNATLSPKSNVGKIQVNSTPTGARIYLDGTDTGKETNALLENVSVGKHTIKLTLFDYEDWSQQIQVYEDQTTTVNASLQRKKTGSISVSFDPNPVYLEGSPPHYTYKVILTETGGVRVTLKELWIYYQHKWWDYSHYIEQWFGRYIPANGRSEFTNTSGAEHQGEDMIWKFIYYDDNGHQNLTSSGTVYLR